VFALAGSFHGGSARARVRVGRTGAAKVVRIRLTAAVPRARRYQVAMGDSLAVGFASPPGQSYVQNLFARYSGSVPGLTLVNFGCSGATSASLMQGGGCSYPGRSSQLKAAEAFLRARARQVRLITIDIGGNDFLPCLSSPAADSTCVDGALNSLQERLTQILARVRAAAGRSVPIVSMSYFNPALVHWFAGAAGQARARASASAAARLTAVISDVYESAGSPVADVAGAFSASDFTMRQDTPWGPLPTNVMRVCQWLNNRCPVPGTSPTLGGVDTNAAGSRAISAAFEKVIPPLAK
jgi:lysophospholipase L1-like esterase